MKKIKLNKLMLLSLLMISVLLSCSEANDMPDPTTTTNSNTAIANLATFHGNMQSNIVVLHAQGGASETLNDDEMLEDMNTAQAQNALWVNVHQVQTLHPERFSRSSITFEYAKSQSAETISIFKQVIDHFKAQGKMVYVYGSSYGAWVVQELIATHGTDVAEGYIIAVGRLNIDDQTWMSFRDGIPALYEYDANGIPTITPSQDQLPLITRNMARLNAGLGFNRYTEKLSNVADLSKLTYVWGNRDEAVGPLSTEEINFLNAKNASVTLVDGGDHGTPVTTAMRMLKTKFGIQ